MLSDERRQSIISWVLRVAPQVGNRKTHCQRRPVGSKPQKKRQCLRAPDDSSAHHHRLPSPTPSHESHQASLLTSSLPSPESATTVEMATAPKTPQKRDRDDGIDNDPTEDTPRAFMTDQVMHDLSDAMSHYSSQASTSQASRTSSPNKRLRDAEVTETGFEVNKINSAELEMPASLDELTKKLDEVAWGIGLLPQSHLTQLQHLVDGHILPPLAFSDGDGSPGIRIPPPAMVSKIKKSAHRLELARDSESEWNHAVHSRLLDWLCQEDTSLVQVRHW